MINLLTLNTIITDLLNIIRSSQVTQSEPISKRQIESWVHQYRALLIKQDLDKGKKPNPDYIQTIQALELEEVDEAEGTGVITDYRTFRTKLQLPKTIDLNFKAGFTYIGTITGEEIQFSSEHRTRWQSYKKYTPNDKCAYLRDGYLYIGNDKEIRYITVRGIFEIPPEISHLNNPNEVVTDVTLDSPYPMPINMIPVLKEMILSKELRIMSVTYSDVTNDSASKLSSNVVREDQRRSSRSSNDDE